MPDGQKIDVMNELISIGLDFLRKQAGVVIVLLAVNGGLLYLVREQKKELSAQIQQNKQEYQDDIKSVRARLDTCERARANLIVQFEVLKARRR